MQSGPGVAGTAVNIFQPEGGTGVRNSYGKKNASIMNELMDERMNAHNLFFCFCFLSAYYRKSLKNMQISGCGERSRGL